MPLYLNRHRGREFDLHVVHDVVEWFAGNLGTEFDLRFFPPDHHAKNSWIVRYQKNAALLVCAVSARKLELLSFGNRDWGDWLCDWLANEMAEALGATLADTFPTATSWAPCPDNYRSLEAYMETHLPCLEQAAVSAFWERTLRTLPEGLKPYLMEEPVEIHA